MELDFEVRDKVLVARFKRKTNLHYGNTEAFKSQMLAVLRPETAVVLDCTNLDFIDSAGLTVLIYLRKKILEHRGTLKLANVGSRILKLMEITRLHRIFEIYDSVDLAIRSLHSPKSRKEDAKAFALQLEVKKAPNFVIIRIKGPSSLVAANSAQFRKKIRKYISQYDTVILNLDAIRNIDSAGIASLIHLKASAKNKKKKIILVYKNRVLVRLFKLYSLEDLFPQFDSEEDAVLAADPQFLKQSAQFFKEKGHAAAERDGRQEREASPERGRISGAPAESESGPQPAAPPLETEFDDLLFLANRAKS